VPNVTAVPKTEAIRRLRAAGFAIEADQLDAWRNQKRGNNWGWDGWIRKNHPRVVHTVWPFWKYLDDRRMAN